MAKKKIKLGLIGCGGNMRGAHLPRLAHDGAVEIVGLADTVAANLERTVKRWAGLARQKSSPRLFENWRELIKQPLDGVVISTPHDQHFAQASAALSKGLHVLIEKPLTIRPDHAIKLIKLAGRKRKKLVVAYQRLFQAQFVYTRELIRSGAIGRIRAVSIYVTQNWGAASGWRMDPKQSGGGMFFDTGSHLVSSMLWLTGLKPVEVSAFSDNDGKPVDINLVVSIKFNNGALGSLDTIGNASRHDERIAIHGSKGSLILDSYGWRPKRLRFNDEVVEIPKRVKPDTPDQAFLNYIRGGTGFERADFAIQVAKLSQAVYRSIQRKCPIRLRV